MVPNHRAKFQLVTDFFPGFNAFGRISTMLYYTLIVLSNSNYASRLKLKHPEFKQKDYLKLTDFVKAEIACCGILL